MNEQQKKLAIEALKDILQLIENDQMIEFQCRFDFCEQRFEGAARHKGGYPEISQGFVRVYSGGRSV